MAGAPESSMRPFLRIQNLFVRDIDATLPRDAVANALAQYCPPAQGKVVVPTHDATGAILGIAYLNFHTAADGALLGRGRFSISPGARLGLVFLAPTCRAY